jgi:peptidyl-prolyl cis-trans isomerase B (cyclophilin B)
LGPVLAILPMKRPWSVLALLVAVPLALGGCGGGGEKKAALPAGCKKVEAPIPKKVKLPKPKPHSRPAGKVSAVVRTSCGSFVIALATKQSPLTTNSFQYLVRKHLYDGTGFHYADSDVIQGGDPLGNGTGGPGYSIDERPPPNLAYTRGVVAMARTEVEPPGRSGSQFFVVATADAGLDPTLALLGRVRRGMNVVERIHSLRASGNRLRVPVVIKGVSLRRG